MKSRSPSGSKPRAPLAARALGFFFALSAAVAATACRSSPPSHCETMADMSACTCFSDPILSTTQPTDTCQVASVAQGTDVACCASGDYPHGHGGVCTCQGNLPGGCSDIGPNWVSITACSVDGALGSP